MDCSTTEKRGKRGTGKPRLARPPWRCSTQPETWELPQPPGPALPPSLHGPRSCVLPCPGLVCPPPQASPHPVAGLYARTQIHGLYAAPGRGARGEPSREGSCWVSGPLCMIPPPETHSLLLPRALLLGLFPATSFSLTPQCGTAGCRDLGFPCLSPLFRVTANPVTAGVSSGFSQHP